MKEVIRVEETKRKIAAPGFYIQKIQRKIRPLVVQPYFPANEYNFDFRWIVDRIGALVIHVPNEEEFFEKLGPKRKGPQLFITN